MLSEITKTLQTQSLMADGAMGSLLLAKGHDFTQYLEKLNLTDKTLIRKIHQEYFDAGAQILLTHTFGANALRLSKQGLKSQMDILNRCAVENLRAVVQDQAYIAGNIGPSGLSRQEMAEISEDFLLQNFFDQATILAQEGVSLISLETFTNLPELKAAVGGSLKATQQKIPLMVSFSPDKNGNLADGTCLQEVITYLNGQSVDVIGLNCCDGPKGLFPLVQKIKTMTSRPLAVKPNAGLPQESNGQQIYPCGPQAFAQEMRHLANLGIKIMGGCCGTTPEYTRELVSGLYLKS